LLAAGKVAASVMGKKPVGFSMDDFVWILKTSDLRSYWFNKLTLYELIFFTLNLPIVYGRTLQVFDFEI
jgi:hypothetical protein